MRVLHEGLVDRIADHAPDYAPIRREFKKADAEEEIATITSP